MHEAPKESFFFSQEKGRHTQQPNQSNRVQTIINSKRERVSGIFPKEKGNLDKEIGLNTLLAGHGRMGFEAMSETLVVVL